MNEPTYTKDQVRKAFAALADEQRQHEAEADGFWTRVIPKPWPPSLLRAVADHDHGSTEPQAIDISALSAEEYAQLREEIGMRNSSDFHGIPEWRRPTPAEGANQ